MERRSAPFALPAPRRSGRRAWHAGLPLWCNAALRGTARSGRRWSRIFDGAVGRAQSVRLDGATLWRQVWERAVADVSCAHQCRACSRRRGSRRRRRGVAACRSPDPRRTSRCRFVRSGNRIRFVARGGIAALTASRDSSVIATATVGNDGVFTPPDVTTGAAGDIFSVEALEVEDDEAAAAPRLAQVPFAVSINAQQFSADAVLWTYLAPQSPMTVSPSAAATLEVPASPLRRPSPRARIAPSLLV